jgi:hypothetical protein
MIFIHSTPKTNPPSDHGTPAFPHDRSDQAGRRISIDGTDCDYFDQLVLAGVATLPGVPATVLPIGGFTLPPLE